MENDGLSLGLGIGDITDCGVCPNLGIVPKELQMVNVFNYFIEVFLGVWRRSFNMWSLYLNLKLWEFEH